MARILGTFIAIIVLIGVAYPFAQDAYHRYKVAQRLDSVMDSRERAEFRNWNGDAISFAKSLYERCELNRGRGAVPCERYRYAFQ